MRTTLPARARLRAAALPAVVTAALVAAPVVAGAAAEPEPAPSGSFVIDAQPVPLNQPTDPGIGVLTPSSDAAEQGMFGPVEEWPLVAMHASVARTGHLVTFGAPKGSTTAQGGLDYDDWDPASGFGDAAHHDTPSMHDYDSFCNSLVALDDGRLLMVGGNSSMSTMLYDPATGTQTMGADLNDQRWYATSLRLPDGRVVVLGGGQPYANPAQTDPTDDSQVALTPEIGDGLHGWTSLSGATSTYAFDARDGHWRYPRAYNAPDGGVVGTSGNRIWTMTVAGTGSLSAAGTLPFDPGVSGSQAMVSPGQILIAGGGEPYNGSTVTATTASAILDVRGATPTVSTTSSMHFARNWLNLTVLPTGDVLANGGTRVGTDDGDANSMRQAEVWDPTTGTWHDAATAQRTRTYHSTALLLPSGAVFTGGGGLPGPQTNLNAELYYPASLFTKAADGTVRWAARPAITAIAGSATWGGALDLTVDGARAVASASLISLPSVTHGENTDQRRIPLAVTTTASGVRASLPASASTMPPGDYELTVVDAEGVPSAAQIITVRRGVAGLVTVASHDLAAPSNSPSDSASMPMDDPTAPTVGPTTPMDDPTTPTEGPTTGAAPAAPEQPAPPVPATPPVAPARTVSLRPGSAVGLDSTSRSGARMRHVGSKLVLATVGPSSSPALQRSTTWIVRAGLSKRRGSVSFESLDRPGYWAVAAGHGTGALVFAKRSKSAAFAARASFTAVDGLTGRNTSLRLTARPKLVLQAQGSRLVLGTAGRSKAGKTAATFTVRAPWTAGG